MKTNRIHQFDAFSAQLFGGNPGAVVLDADNLTEKDMKNIAREMNNSATGYVLTSQRANFRLRYFTPSDAEITFCGHVTLATLATIAKEKRFGADQGIVKQYDIEINAGLVKGEIDWSGKEPIISFFPLSINLDPLPFNHAQLAEALAINLDAIDQSKPILMEKTNRYVYFAIKSLQQLKELNINQKTAKVHAEQHNIILYCALTPHGVDENSHAHSRVFGPLIGIAEDPVTGSSQGPLTAYMVRNGMIPQPLAKVNTEQGDFVGRPGRTTVYILRRDPIEVKVSGPAFHVFSADIQIP
ncbi:uncharacterized protein TRIADDRAFT_60898 [Trichoplax adhaerens]|uniref:Uncharacterized protein n=1 Tax=Trichoplax adhaerens TaxID=10228 RepID=B3S9G4_TRIAD|nr:hypothetical protein TRIADDRAFT_60898 [Trichoplax adhaerens]EDV20697.1 hypothetical protein TRIADDRAFT_60898 [Trichoplax adhaerens]|eukprot:XP_002116897.1 hypothetical protein TRIADDRAFT_60898 [Trichoplax adhaerens]